MSTLMVGTDMDLHRNDYPVVPNVTGTECDPTQHSEHKDVTNVSHTRSAYPRDSSTYSVMPSMRSCRINDVTISRILSILPCGPCSGPGPGPLDFGRLRRRRLYSIRNI